MQQEDIIQLPGLEASLALAAIRPTRGQSRSYINAFSGSESSDSGGLVYKSSLEKKLRCNAQEFGSGETSFIRQRMEQSTEL